MLNEKEYRFKQKEKDRKRPDNSDDLVRISFSYFLIIHVSCYLNLKSPSNTHHTVRLMSRHQSIDLNARGNMVIGKGPYSTALSRVHSHSLRLCTH